MPVISDIEYIAENQLIPAISDAISDLLAAIDSEKDDGIVTDVPLRYHQGVSLVEGEYPSVAVMGMRETPFADEEEWRISNFVYDIECYLVGDDPEKLEKKCLRYGRALKNILWDAFPSRGAVETIEYPPVFSRGSVLYKGISVIFKLLVKENKSD